MLHLIMCYRIRCIYFILAMLLCSSSFNPLNAQPLSIDIKQDWYAEVAHIEFSMLDTLTLYPLKGNISNKSVDVLVWRFVGGKEYRLKVYNNTNTALAADPFTYAPEKWTLQKLHDGNWYLQARENKDPRPFHKKLAYYKLQLFRNDHGILYKMLLIKEYNARSAHALFAPGPKN